MPCIQLNFLSQYNPPTLVKNLDNVSRRVKTFKFQHVADFNLMSVLYYSQQFLHLK
jgi:hypothetical protein